jgi:predicted secreted protein
MRLSNGKVARRKYQQVEIQEEKQGDRSGHGSIHAWDALAHDQ